MYIYSTYQHVFKVFYLGINSIIFHGCQLPRFPALKIKSQIAVPWLRRIDLWQMRFAKTLLIDDSRGVIGGMYMYIYIYTHVCIYIYIYLTRWDPYIHMYMYIFGRLFWNKSGFDWSVSKWREHDDSYRVSNNINNNMRLRCSTNGIGGVVIYPMCCMVLEYLLPRLPPRSRRYVGKDGTTGHHRGCGIGRLPPRIMSWLLRVLRAMGLSLVP